MNIKALLTVLFLACFCFACKQDIKPTLFLVGDSTMANKKKLYLPERGWGQALPPYFNESILIENHAKNGRSTRSFIYQGRWDSVCNSLKAGDFVILQFGHNDGSKKKTERYATPVEYEYNFKKFIADIREKQAHPILATSVARRRFDKNNHFYDTHGVYPDIVRKISKELNVPLLEMHKKSMAYFSELGIEKSKKAFLHIEPMVYDSLPDGLVDNTHFSEFGADKVAKIAVDEIALKVPNLSKYLNK